MFWGTAKVTVDKTSTGKGGVATAVGRGGAVHIADVAAHAGVSIATVSRALTNPDRVNPATRARVLEVVRALGYMPNVSARSLRAARTRTVLVMLPSFLTPFFTVLLKGVDDALSELGYGLLMGSVHEHDQAVRLVDMTAAGQADGVLLLDGRIPRGSARSLAELHVPIVGVSVPLPGDAPVVLVRERAAAAAVAAHLLALGHRRFGYITGPAGNHVDAERWAGYAATLAEAGIAPAAIHRFPGDFRVETGRAAGRRYLALPDRPSAIFAASDMMAIGFLKEVRGAGLAVPGDVSLVGYDGIEFADYCEPVLTTIRQPREAMGRAAATLLVRLIEGQPIARAERRPELAAELRIGGSSGPAPAS